jgi:hypothetical protein
MTSTEGDASEAEGPRPAEKSVDGRHKAGHDDQGGGKVGTDEERA